MSRHSMAGLAGLAAVAGLAGVALLAAGCGSAASRSASTARAFTAADRHNLAAAYVKIAVAGNERLDHDFDGLEDASADNLAQARADLRDAASTERRFDAGLRRLTFPAQDQMIVRYLYWVNQARARLSDAAAGATSLRQLAGYQHRLDQANVPVEQAVDIIRSDLRLPPADTH